LTGVLLAGYNGNNNDDGLRKAEFLQKGNAIWAGIRARSMLPDGRHSHPPAGPGCPAALGALVLMIVVGVFIQVT
jgi:hypothetical protein